MGHADKMPGARGALGLEEAEWERLDQGLRLQMSALAGRAPESMEAALAKILSARLAEKGILGDKAEFFMGGGRLWARMELGEGAMAKAAVPAPAAARALLEQSPQKAKAALDGWARARLAQWESAWPGLSRGKALAQLRAAGEFWEALPAKRAIAQAWFAGMPEYVGARELFGACKLAQGEAEELEKKLGCSGAHCRPGDVPRIAARASCMGMEFECLPDWLEASGVAGMRGKKPKDAAQWAQEASAACSQALEASLAAFRSWLGECVAGAVPADARLPAKVAGEICARAAQGFFSAGKQSGALRLDSRWLEIPAFDERFGQARATALDLAGAEVEIAQAKLALSELPAGLEEFYPLARKAGRKLRLLSGPTNSGKTHRAMEKMRSCRGACVYLAPLRLLAMEVRDRLAQAGAPASLVTGELVELAPGARIESSTIEMLDFDKEYELAVIDEGQMSGDGQRGGAWLSAVLGVNAKEVWVLSSPEFSGAMERLAELLGEPLEKESLRALSPYEVEKRCADPRHLEPGSAVVAFSRRGVLDWAQRLREAGKTCSVVYGALSPEVRKEQARKFREGETDIVVATDAIGLGLNLPIRRMYFAQKDKFDGETMSPADRHLVWQIAGRAGRYGTEGEGMVGALDEQTLAFVKKQLSRRPDPVGFPLPYDSNWQMAEKISAALGTSKLGVCLEFFFTRMSFPGQEALFYPKRDESQLEMAMALDKIDEKARAQGFAGLDLRRKLLLSRAPAPHKKGRLDKVFHELCAALAKGQPARLEAFDALRAQAGDLEECEFKVKALTLYCWLSNRFGKAFPDAGQARAKIEECERNIDRLLSSKSRRARPHAGGGAGNGAKHQKGPRGKGPKRRGRGS